MALLSPIDIETYNGWTIVLNTDGVFTATSGSETTQAKDLTQLREMIDALTALRTALPFFRSGSSGDIVEMEEQLFRVLEEAGYGNAPPTDN